MVYHGARRMPYERKSIMTSVVQEKEDQYRQRLALEANVEDALEYLRTQWSGSEEEFERVACAIAAAALHAIHSIR